MTARRGTHGCYVHVEVWGNGSTYSRRVKSSRHSAPTTAPGSRTLLAEATCTRCGATVVRTVTIGGYREAWTIR